MSRTFASGSAIRTFTCPNPSCRKAFAGPPNEVSSKISRHIRFCEGMTDAQRASAGFIISEATQVSQQGQGYPGTPGIHSKEQVQGWKLITDAVHKNGGHIFLQLWHVGRISHSSHQPNNSLPVAPSAIAAKNSGTYTADWKPTPILTPRALEASELPGVIQDYVNAAKNAKEAGLDGVEVHMANGYLLDEFLQDGSNKRTDEFGGSIENRVKFPMQVLDAVIGVFGKDRVAGIRTPCGYWVRC